MENADLSDVTDERSRSSPKLERKQSARKGPQALRSNANNYGNKEIGIFNHVPSADSSGRQSGNSINKAAKARWSRSRKEVPPVSFQDMVQ